MAVTPLLRAEGITKAYGGVQALGGASLDVAEGTIAGLIGPNGSGKTTLFNVISGYERPDTGRVCLAGRSITGVAPPAAFAAGIGRTFQLPRIFPRLTVAENMLVPSPPRTRRRRPRAMEALEIVGLASHAGVAAGSLSYGQRKLLELAVVLVAAPRVVLLDEPAAGVSPALVSQLAALIGELRAGGMTFLVIEHNMDLVLSLCSDITVMASGVTVVSGPPEVIRADQRVIDAYLGSGLDDSAGFDGAAGFEEAAEFDDRTGVNNPAGADGDAGLGGGAGRSDSASRDDSASRGDGSAGVNGGGCRDDSAGRDRGASSRDGAAKRPGDDDSPGKQARR
jgi:neutral amino acid transport system ATP-binding protein